MIVSRENTDLKATTGIEPVQRSARGMFCVAAIIQPYAKALPHRANGREHGTEGATSMQEQPIPYGCCRCGCGGETRIARWSSTRDGYVKGEPVPYIKGHHLFRPVAERLWEKVDKNGPVPAARPDLGPCWIWLGSSSPLGYGHLAVDGKKRPTHRVAYELVVGPIPEGTDDLDHLCRNPPCVNPAHLEPVTHRENMRRGKAATKTHCPHGHSLGDCLITPAGHRRCRQCDRERSRKAYRAKRAADIDPADLAEITGHSISTANTHYVHALNRSYDDVRKAIG